MDTHTEVLAGWLERRWMRNNVNTLLDNDWARLEDIKAAAPAEHAAIINLFDKPGLRLKMRLLLEELKDVDVAALYAQLNGGGANGAPGVTASGSTAMLASAVDEDERAIVDDSSDSDDDGGRAGSDDEHSEAASSLSLAQANQQTPHTPPTSSTAPAEQPPLAGDAAGGKEPPASGLPPAPAAPNGARSSLPPPIPPRPSLAPKQTADGGSVSGATASGQSGPPVSPQTRPAQPPQLQPPVAGGEGNPSGSPPYKRSVSSVPPPATSLPPFPESSDDSDSDAEAASGAAPAAGGTPPATTVDAKAPIQSESRTSLPPTRSDDSIASANSSVSTPSRPASKVSAMRNMFEQGKANPENDAQGRRSNPNPSGTPNASSDVKSKAAGLGAAIAAAMNKPPPSFKKPADQPTSPYSQQPVAATGGHYEPHSTLSPTSPRGDGGPHAASHADRHDQGASGPSESGRTHEDADDKQEDGDSEDLPALASIGHPEKTGMLAKRGTGLMNRQFKDRYFVLKNDSLYWAKTSVDAIPLGRVRLSEPGLTMKLTDPLTLEIASKKKVYVVKGRAPDEMVGWLKALTAAQHHFKDAPAPVEVSAAFAHVDPAMAKRLDRLKTGAIFLKYKHKKGKERLIWLPASLDRIIWGSEGKKEVKGFVMVSDLLRISEGCFGSARNENAFTLVAKTRTVELEASSKSEKEEWVTVIQYLIDNKPR